MTQTTHQEIAEMTTDYGKLNRTAPHRVIATTYNNLAYGTLREWIEVELEAYGNGNVEALYGVRLLDENGVIDREHFIAGPSVASTVKEFAEAMNTKPQATRLYKAIANMKTYYGL